MLTKQSSTVQDGDSDHAVDGVLESNFPRKSCMSTQTEDNPWWMVDLGGVFQIEFAAITNRHDCCQNKLQDVQFTIGRYIS